MIDVHYWPTPNGWKVTIMLEECGLPYQVFGVNMVPSSRLMVGRSISRTGFFAACPRRTRCLIPSSTARMHRTWILRRLPCRVRLESDSNRPGNALPF